MTQENVLSEIEAQKREDEAKIIKSVVLSGGNERGKESNLEEEIWWDEEPFLPRPIVSIHVRQGDKGVEMKLYSLEAHMWLAERLKRKVPDIKTVWLSTEMQVNRTFYNCTIPYNSTTLSPFLFLFQGVIDDSKKFPNWTFLYTNNTRQKDLTTSMQDYTLQVGETELTVLSFANLIISSECDYFIGALGSNWNRLINELRLTNGRLKAGVLAVNVDEE